MWLFVPGRCFVANTGLFWLASSPPDAAARARRLTVGDYFCCLLLHESIHSSSFWSDGWEHSGRFLRINVETQYLLLHLLLFDTITGCPGAFIAVRADAGEFLTGKRLLPH